MKRSTSELSPAVPDACEPTIATARTVGTAASRSATDAISAGIPISRSLAETKPGRHSPHRRRVRGEADADGRAEHDDGSRAGRRYSSPCCCAVVNPQRRPLQVVRAKRTVGAALIVRLAVAEIGGHADHDCVDRFCTCQRCLDDRLHSFDDRRRHHRQRLDGRWRRELYDGQAAHFVKRSDATFHERVPEVEHRCACRCRR